MRERIAAALTEATRSQNRRRMSTLRLICAAIKDRDIAARGQGRDRVCDEEVLEILAKMVRQREESARLYEEAGRLELAEQEREEIEIIREFLPRQMSEEEMRSACAQVVHDAGAQGLRDMGRTMSMLKERFPGQMDFGKASALLKEMLR